MRWGKNPSRSCCCCYYISLRLARRPVARVVRLGLPMHMPVAVARLRIAIAHPILCQALVPEQNPVRPGQKERNQSPRLASHLALSPRTQPHPRLCAQVGSPEARRVKGRRGRRFRAFVWSQSPSGPLSAFCMPSSPLAHRQMDPGDLTAHIAKSAKTQSQPSWRQFTTENKSGASAPHLWL